MCQLKLADVSNMVVVMSEVPFPGESTFDCHKRLAARIVDLSLDLSMKQFDPLLKPLEVIAKI